MKAKIRAMVRVRARWARGGEILGAGLEVGVR